MRSPTEVLRLAVLSGVAVATLASAGSASAAKEVLLAIPAPPIITLAPPALSSQRNVVATCAGAVNATAFTWVLSIGGVAQAPAVTRTCSFAANGLGDGAYGLSVTQTVVLQGTSLPAALAFTVDGTPPVAPRLTTAPAAFGNDPAPVFAWAASEPGGSVSWRILRDGIVVQGPTAAAAQAKPAPLVDGTYTLQVNHTDAAGNVSAPTSAVFVVDVTPPAPLQLLTPLPAAVSVVPKLALTGTEANLAVSWALTGSASRAGTGANPDFGLLLDGSYTLQASAADRAGNRSAPLQVPFVLDRVAPAPPVLTARAPEIVQSPRAFFAWSGEAGGQFSWSILQGASSVQGPRSTTDRTATTDELKDGVYSLQVVQSDAAGNRSAPTTSAPFRVVVPRAPSRLVGVGKPRRVSARDGIGRKPRVRPFGLLRPSAGTRLKPSGRVLSWRVRYGPPASLYNLQVFDQHRHKLISAFPSTQQQRLPVRFGKAGMRYYWQVWGFVPGKGYGKVPIGLSYFDVPKK